MLRTSFTHRPLSLGRHVLVSAIAATLAAAAAPAVAQQGDAQPRTLRKVDVQADADAGYKPERASSPKYTEPLRDIPQTVQVVPAKVIEDQNQFSLYEMLRNVPGITFSAAEGGNSFGDAINLRGNRAENDIQVDCIRDSAQTSRTHPFKL
jgi:catecholate siderophore receptor